MMKNLMKHFVLNDSLIFDEFLEYVDLKYVELEINLHLIFEMMILKDQLDKVEFLRKSITFNLDAN